MGIELGKLGRWDRSCYNYPGETGVNSTYLSLSLSLSLSCMDIHLCTPEATKDCYPFVRNIRFPRQNLMKPRRVEVCDRTQDITARLTL